MKTYFIFLLLILEASSFGISNEKWKLLIGEKANMPYLVKPGDSLSKISRDQLGRLDYWPKVWEINRDTIRNPHLLEPEQKILFSGKDNSVTRGPASEEPLSRKKKDDGVTDQLLRGKFAHQHRIRYFFLEEEEVLGVITGSYDQKNYLGVESQIYIGAKNRKKLSAGKRYAIVRDAAVPVISKKTSKQFSQPLVQVIGEVEIQSFGDELARASIVSAFDLIERGDRIMDIPAMSMQEPPLTPPVNLMLKVVVGDNLDEELFVQGQLLVLDQGSLSGVQVGYVFNVFEDTDPIFNDQSLIEPHSKGEIKVVRVSQKSSIGYIQKSQSGIAIGDVLVARGQVIHPIPSFDKLRTNMFLD